MVLRCSSYLALGLCLAASAFAQGESIETPFSSQPAEHYDESLGSLTEEAAAVVIYDDGEADVWIKSGATTYEVAMLFDNVGGPDVTLGGVDFCWRQDGGDPKIRYEVVLWAPNGPGGAPGTELARFAAVANGVTGTPTFYNTGLNYPLTNSDVYIGVRYNPAVDPDYWFCVDNDGLGGAPPQPGYRRANESGAWATISTIPGANAYKALMVRAYVSTPGVFAETLLVPYFLVDKSSPFGTATLFAVRNLTTDPVSAEVEYFTREGLSQRTENFSLGPLGTTTRNLRDVPGLVTSMDGFARGYVTITTAGDPDLIPVLGGDYFQVDVDDDFATGDKLVRQIELCDHASIRFLVFPLPGSGTRLTVWNSNPRGAGPGDPASFTVQAYSEPGVPSGPLWLVKTSLHALEFDATTFSGLTSGTLKFDFTNSGGGTVYAEASAEGRFSVGVSSQCDEIP